jgi:hypothetical protein
MPNVTRSSPATASTTAPAISTPTSPATRCGAWSSGATERSWPGRSARCSSTAGRTSSTTTARFKLRALAETYFITRDAALVRDLRPHWQKEIDLILADRDAGSGLLPREKYCSDIDTRIRSNNANANAWRGLRDMGLVLEDIGEREQAQRLAAVAASTAKSSSPPSTDRSSAPWTRRSSRSPWTADRFPG